MTRRLVGMLIAVITALSLAASAGSALQRGPARPDHCCATHCPGDRTESEPQEASCEEAPPVTIGAGRLRLRQPIVAPTRRPPQAAARPVSRALECTAYRGPLDRTLLGQRTSLLH